jgi:hypothetical protein
VLLVGGYAIKFPHASPPAKYELGVRANLAEAATFSVAAEKGWHELCPILWSHLHGLFLVMPRVRLMTREEYDDYYERDAFPGHDQYPPCEYKPERLGLPRR